MDDGLSYVEVGHGLPVVLLHAFPLNRTMWEPQISALFGECRCIIPDLRGFGDSDTTGPFSMERFADDVVQLLDALRIDRAVICGLSMGGYVALALIRHHRQRVRALILADTRSGADDTERAKGRRELMAVARDQGIGAVVERQLPGLIGKRTRDRQPDLVTRVRDLILAAPIAGVIGAADAMLHRPDSTDLLSTIDVPTLVIVGEEDVITPPKEARELSRGIPNSRLEIIPGAGHLSNLERPAAFNTALSDFVGSLLYN
jgi:3-oxoadipate enol-lactonase